MRALVCALIASALLPAAARAETYTAAADSPRNAALPAGQDIAKVASSVDDDAGTWSIDVTLPGEPETADSAAINGVLYGTSASGGCGDVLAYLRASTNPANTQVTGTVTPTTSPRAAQAASRTAAGATITLVMTDSAFVGARPGCLTLTLSNGGVKDEVESVPFAGPKLPPIATPTPDPTPTPAPLTVRFAHPGARLHASSSGIVAIALAPFARAVSGTVTVRAGGRTLGRRTYRAKAATAVTVRVRLNASSRRSLARGRTLSVRVGATARAGGDTASRTIGARIQRTRTRTLGE